MFYYDPTYILVLIGAALCMWASARVNSTYARYAQVMARSGITGAEAARRILQANSVYDVQIQHVSGNLTDHYDPRSHTVSLSDAVYDRSSVAAIGVAAHECGHVLQHATGYLPLSIRTALVPVANFGAGLGFPLVFIGLLLGQWMGGDGLLSYYIVRIGLLLFLAAVAFQLLTLPVEFDASRRALRILESQGILDSDELAGSRKVLRAAAMTYVASAASAVLSFLRLFLIAGGGRRRGRD